jgi:hypothetical protein
MDGVDRATGSAVAAFEERIDVRSNHAQHKVMPGVEPGEP